MTIPSIETDRLILRAHRAEDFPLCAKMWADPAVTRFTIGTPSPAPQTWRRLLAYLGHWSLLGYGYWAVEEKASSQYVGELGFADYKRDIQPSIHGIPELGWALSPHVHGRGYATEALRAAVQWGDANLASARTVCLILPENAASLRVAAKLGYREYARSAGGELLFERAQ
jgi:RimJ/RimL family protein N-acetyltransferase